MATKARKGVPWYDMRRNSGRHPARPNDLVVPETARPRMQVQFLADGSMVLRAEPAVFLADELPNLLRMLISPWAGPETVQIMLDAIQRLDALKPRG